MLSVRGTNRNVLPSIDIFPLWQGSSVYNYDDEIFPPVGWSHSKGHLEHMVRNQNHLRSSDHFATPCDVWVMDYQEHNNCHGHEFLHYGYDLQVQIL